MWPQGTQPLLQHGDDKDGCICAQRAGDGMNTIVYCSVGTRGLCVVSH
uniref:Uncharacterized protein n=1 Tax=Anguilla anguilla TaxID=7936 RepID=A0A0E9QUK7_ANGAN